MAGYPITAKKPPKVIEIMAKDALHAQGALGQKWRVVGVYDISGSTEFAENQFYSDGIMQGLTERVVGAAMAVDDDGVVPVYAHNDRCTRVREDAQVSNLEGYIGRNFRNIGGGTSYAPVIHQIMADADPGDPMLVLWFTDGANGDQREAEEAIIEASAYPIFFQFFGIYAKGGKPSLPFLERLDNLSGRRVDNAGLSKINMHTITDGDLMSLIFHEAAGFPALAQKAGLLPWTAAPAATQKRGLFGRR